VYIRFFPYQLFNWCQRFIIRNLIALPMAVKHLVTVTEFWSSDDFELSFSSNSIRFRKEMNRLGFIHKDFFSVKLYYLRSEGRVQMSFALTM
jgi:hypothetical protein